MIFGRSQALRHASSLCLERCTAAPTRQGSNTASHHGVGVGLPQRAGIDEGEARVLRRRGLTKRLVEQARSLRLLTEETPCRSCPEASGTYNRTRHLKPPQACVNPTACPHSAHSNRNKDV